MRKLIDSSQTANTSRASKKSSHHESARRQVTGQARYVDDIPEPGNILYAAIGISKETCGKLQSIDLSAVLASEGVVDVITAEEIPGHIDIGPVFAGDPLLAHQEIKFNGQPVFAVLANTIENARKAALLGKISVSPQTPVLSVDEAHKQKSFVRPSHAMSLGEVDRGLEKAPLVSTGNLSIGGQEHLYLEGQISLAIPEEEDRVFIYTSSQHPSEVQKLVAEVLDIKLHKVTVDMRRMGGGFGGKETQAAQWACIAALFASRNKRAVKLRIPRQQDMITTGKRHPFHNSYRIGYDERGKILAADISINGDCGHSPDLSDAIVDRAMFHADNCYYLGDSKIVGHRLKTNVVSHTAYRGFGGPQGMIMAEAMLDRIARETQQDPLTVRKLNLYGHSNKTTTPYGMEVEHETIHNMLQEIETSSNYWQRRKEITEFNLQNPVVKKGLALSPVKFGISFTAKHLNQAGALLHIYTDGSIQINHGGTEMGQGLHTKIGQIVANEFGLELEQIEVTSTRTDKVPNTSPTAASSGTDLNGKAAQNACLIVKERLVEFYAKQLGETPLQVNFKEAFVYLNSHKISFVELVQQAYFARVSLSASGFYKTPKIHYDRASGKGRPFFYFAYGLSVSEVCVDTLTGEYQVKRVDILHDVGNSINPSIDIGQIEGGFIQGMGWLSTEDLRWDETGKLISNNLATYKIPAIGDTPEEFNVNLYNRPNEEDTIYHSKAVGEPPFMLAISVWLALKDAIASLQDYKIDPDLPTPATPEQVLKSINKIKKGAP